MLRDVESVAGSVDGRSFGATSAGDGFGLADLRGFRSTASLTSVLRSSRDFFTSCRSPSIYLTEIDTSVIKGILWDARDLDVTDVTQNQIRQIISFIVNSSQKRESGKAAWVVQDAVSFGMGRMFQIISENNMDLDIKIFRDYSQAEEWISR